MGTPLYTFVQKSAQQVRDDLIRTEKNGFIGIGISNPNVGPNSDIFIRATALGNEIAVGQANTVILADQLMPDTATGAYLDRWLGVFGQSRRAAAQSSGVVTPTISVTSTLIPTGSQLVDSTGLLYQVLVGGMYGTAPGLTVQVPVQSIAGGKATNHANGDTLRWVTAPAFCADTVSVGTTGGSDGLAGGFDSEVGVDEPPRNRLFSTLQNPPKGGNAADLAGWCGQSTPDVQAAFVYPTLMGPGTALFVVMGAAQTTAPLSSNSKNRDLPTTLVGGTVVPYVQGKAAEYAYIVGATVTNQPSDVAILLALPAATTASPAGPGGGWLDGTPWPSTLSGGATIPAANIPTVTAVTNSTNIQVQLATGTPGPTAGVSHIAYLSPFTWTLNTATVIGTPVNVSGSVWNIQLDTPWPDVSVGAFIFPQSVQQTNYVAAALTGFALLGPGEWSTNAGVLQRGFRHPAPTAPSSWPYSLDANFLRQITNAGPEVLAASFLYRLATTPNVPTTVTVNASQQLTSTPPSILVPRNLGFYAA